MPKITKNKITITTETNSNQHKSIIITWQTKLKNIMEQSVMYTILTVITENIKNEVKIIITLTIKLITYS